MTNPSVLLLDEPTSGLDSHTALQIAKLLRAESRRGMTVLASVHLPSSEIFHTFDRVILLSDGRTLYNGPTYEVPSFLASLSVKIGQYQNPADVLLKLAHAPILLHPALSVAVLAEKCEKDS